MLLSILMKRPVVDLEMLTKKSRPFLSGSRILGDNGWIFPVAESSENINRVLPLPHKPDDLLIITSSGALYSFKSGKWDKLIPTASEGEKTAPEENSLEREKCTLDKACVWNERYLVFVRRKRDLCTMDFQDGNQITILWVVFIYFWLQVQYSFQSLVIQLQGC